jgi:hypothetical protein
METTLNFDTNMVDAAIEAIYTEIRPALIESLPKAVEAGHEGVTYTNGFLDEELNKDVLFTVSIREHVEDHE